MSELETKKNTIVHQLRNLCAHCASGNITHACRVQRIAVQVQAIRGVPLIVNNEFRGVLNPSFR